jgi:hypothetical protein
LMVQALDNGTPALSGSNTVIVDLRNAPDVVRGRGLFSSTTSDPMGEAIAAQQSWVQDFVGEQSSEEDLVVMLPQV